MCTIATLALLTRATTPQSPPKRYQQLSRFGPVNKYSSIGSLNRNGSSASRNRAASKFRSSPFY